MYWFDSSAPSSLTPLRGVFFIPPWFIIDPLSNSEVNVSDTFSNSQREELHRTIWAIARLNLVGKSSVNKDEFFVEGLDGKWLLSTALLECSNNDARTDASCVRYNMPVSSFYRTLMHYKERYYLPDIYRE